MNLEPILLQLDLALTNYIYKEPVPKKVALWECIQAVYEGVGTVHSAEPPSLNFEYSGFTIWLDHRVNKCHFVCFHILMFWVTSRLFNVILQNNLLTIKQHILMLSIKSPILNHDILVKLCCWTLVLHWDIFVVPWIFLMFCIDAVYWIWSFLSINTELKTHVVW